MREAEGVRVREGGRWRERCLLCALMKYNEAAKVLLILGNLLLSSGAQGWLELGPGLLHIFKIYV